MLAGDGFEIRAVMPFWGGSVTRAELVPADGGDAGRCSSPSRARAPRGGRGSSASTRALYASRHVVKGAAQVALAIIGLTFLLRFLPAIPWPDIDLPSIPLPHIDLPDIPWPSIDLPDIEVPGWIKAIAESKQYWLPIVVGIFARQRGAQAPETP